MGKALDYSTEQVTTALLVLAENAGSPTKAAQALQAELPGIDAATLGRWKNETHAERYRQIDERYGLEMEGRAIQRARHVMETAAEIELELLEEVRGAKGDLAPQALRAVADVKSKNVNAVLALTGRSPTGQKDTGGDVIKLFQGMVDKGWLKLSPGVDLEPPKQG